MRISLIFNTDSGRAAFVFIIQKTARRNDAE